MVTALLSSLKGKLATLSSSSATKKGSVVGAAMFSGVGLDQLLEKRLFICPRVHYQTYGTIFMVIPGIIIALLTFLTSKFFIDGFQGCYKANAPRKVLFKQFLKIFLLSTGSFLSYVAVCFLRYQYYVCLTLGPKPKTNVDVELFDSVTARSQIIGWCMITGLITIGFIGVVIQLCFLTDPNHDPDFPDRSKYERLEAIAAANMYHEKMKQLAEDEGAARVEMLFDERKHKLKQDPVEFMSEIRRKMLKKYPRGTGDLTLPYRDPIARRYDKIKTYLDDHQHTPVESAEIIDGNEIERLMGGDSSSDDEANSPRIISR